MPHSVDDKEGVAGPETRAQDAVTRRTRHHDGHQFEYQPKYANLFWLDARAECGTSSDLTL